MSAGGDWRLISLSGLAFWTEPLRTDQICSINYDVRATQWPKGGKCGWKMRTSSKTRSLERSLDILELLAARGPSALHELQRASGLPKSTLRRLLETLTRRQFVRRGLADGVYRCNITVPNRGNRTHQGMIARLINIATPFLLDANEAIRWPIDLHIQHEGRMQIIESTRAISPLGFNHPYRAEVELNMFASASGLCYLSTLSNQSVLKLADTLRNQELWSPARYRISPRRLLQELGSVRKNGYAQRLANQTDQGNFHAIAVPIFSGTTGIGAVSVWWPRAYLPVTAFAQLHAMRLQELARAISSGIQ